MSSFLTQPWADILTALHGVEVLDNGDAPELGLLTRNVASGALEEFGAVSSGWTRARINQGFGVFSDEFQIAENLISPEEARKVQAIRHGEVIFQLADQKIPPSGFDRYWRLLVKPTETGA